MGEAESGVTYANKDNSIKETFIIDFLQKDTSNIRACCRGKQKTAYGYIWKYERDVIKNETIGIN